MALSDDQRALLRLLAQREEGYEDIAALKGKSVEEVRAEVREALGELQAAGEEPLRPPPPEEPPPPAPEPERPAEPTPRPAEPKVTPAAAQRPARPSVPAERRRFLLLAGGALGIVAVVLALFALIGGSDSDSDGGTAASAGAEAAAAENGKVTQAVLTAEDGSDAAGSAVFGRVGKEEIVLQVTADGLEPTADGESYTVWLFRTPKLSLRVGSAPVGEAGRLGAQFPIPAELLAYVASGAFDQVKVTRTSDAAYQREVRLAQANKSLPRFTGEPVLTGKITGPVAEAG